MMKEHGIIMSAPMVKALLDDTKTNTRRMQGLKEINEDPEHWRCENFSYSPAREKECAVFENTAQSGSVVFIPCPYGVADDRLWVRETHYRYGRWLKNGLTKTGRKKWKFKALDIALGKYLDETTPELVTVRGCVGWHKRPSIFMPRSLSRITLELTGVRVERLQEISYQDCIAEGIVDDVARNEKRVSAPGERPCEQYQVLWDSLHGKGACDLNPWVWVLELKKL